MSSGDISAELEKIATTESKYPSWYPPGLVLSLERMDRYARPKMSVQTKEPADLRAADNQMARCGLCQNFVLSLGKAWKGKGRCAAHRIEVEDQQTCDSFRAIYEEPGKVKRAGVREHLRALDMGAPKGPEESDEPDAPADEPELYEFIADPRLS